MLGPSFGPAGSASDEDAGSIVLPAGSVADLATTSGFVPAGDADWEHISPTDRTQFGQSVASAGNVDDDYGDDIIVGAPFDGTYQGEGMAYLFLSAGGGLDGYHSWSQSGGTGGANFGSSVASAGDVNGDDIDDVIIGAPGYKAEVKVGRAFVYEGDPGTGLTIDHTWSYTGTVKDGEFGYAVAGAGDINGDDIDDIVVGARWYTDDTDTEAREGAIFVFFGSESGPSQEPDWVIDSDQGNALLGTAVSAAGDVNGDGYDDLIAGAPNYMNEEDEHVGAAFLFLGSDSPSPPASAAWIAYGMHDGARLGTSVAGVGDVNGDNHPDVVVSAPKYHRPSDEAEVGAAFAYCGNGSGLGSSPCWTALGSQPGAAFGTSVGAAGDVNADSYDDVIVGAPLYLNDLPDETHPEGAAFLYFGSETGLSPWAGWKARGDKSKTDFGASVSTAGKVNGAEADGVLIGAPQYFVSTEPYGAAFVFYGPIEPAAMNRTFLPLVMR